MKCQRDVGGDLQRVLKLGQHGAKSWGEVKGSQGDGKQQGIGADYSLNSYRRRRLEGSLPEQRQRPQKTINRRRHQWQRISRTGFSNIRQSITDSAAPVEPTSPELGTEEPPAEPAQDIPTTAAPSEAEIKELQAQLAQRDVSIQSLQEQLSSLTAQEVITSIFN
jgi:hypothetical protein